MLDISRVLLADIARNVLCPQVLFLLGNAATCKLPWVLFDFYKSLAELRSHVLVKNWGPINTRPGCRRHRSPSPLWCSAVNLPHLGWPSHSEASY
jgi:hypothetical protein